MILLLICYIHEKLAIFEGREKKDCTKNAEGMYLKRVADTM